MQKIIFVRSLNKLLNNSKKIEVCCRLYESTYQKPNIVTIFEKISKNPAVYGRPPKFTSMLLRVVARLILARGFGGLES